jgi:hypothetical protein
MAIINKDERYMVSNVHKSESSYDDASINLTNKDQRAKNINSKGQQRSSKRDHFNYDDVKENKKQTAFAKRDQFNYDDADKHKGTTKHFQRNAAAELQNKTSSDLERYKKYNSTDLSPRSDGLKVSTAFDELIKQNNPNSSIKTNKLSRIVTEKSQEKQLSEKISETTVTINIGKITVRSMKASDSYYAKGNEVKEPEKLSLNDYLRKRKAQGW